LEEATIKSLVKKYSEFITFPIYLWSEQTETKEVPIESDSADIEDDVEDVEESETPKTKSVSRTFFDWVKLNENKPIWTRSSSDVKEAEYQEFYKAYYKDHQGLCLYST
jgi:heat shock protein beta